MNKKQRNRFFFAVDEEEKIALKLLYSGEVTAEDIARWYWPSDWESYVDHVKKKTLFWYLGREWRLTRFVPELAEVLKEKKLVTNGERLFLVPKDFELPDGVYDEQKYIDVFIRKRRG